VSRKRPNRLAREKSPYLLQHACNPVDWYPWGDEAFRKARLENKPIFLSIGYSTCHWCHVMEKESFEDENVARLLNEIFVPIKVDREERPDIDSYYMTVCQIMTGTGGWPLTIIMNHEKIPFYAATYLPRESRFGRIGLLELVPQITTAWRSRQGQIQSISQEVAELVRKSTELRKETELPETTLLKLYGQLKLNYDKTNGGFGAAPKFPSPQNLLFLMNYWIRTRQKEAMEMVNHTLTSMRMGGIYDHIGYGFHRYSTDAKWRLPHFEKMLYDQALLIMVYTEAYALTRNPLYQITGQETIAYVLRDMKAKQGAFYSAEDADSEGKEGKFYLWKNNETKEILDAAEASLVQRTFNITEDGNYADETTQNRNGNNILYMTRSQEELAHALGVSNGEFAARLDAAREKMFAHRLKRTPPQKDNKILCDWNGLMIAALAKAAITFNSSHYKQAAVEAADFLLAEMRDPEGIMYHRFIDGERAIPGFLDDYTFAAWGFVEAYEATFEIRYLRAAVDLTDETVARFWDESNSAFFFTEQDNDLPFRNKELHDSAIPSGNSVALLNMLRLARLTGRQDLEERAFRFFESFAYHVQNNPLSYVHTLRAFAKVISPTTEIVIVGKKRDPATRDMLRTAQSSILLDVDLLLKPVGEDADMVQLAPFTRGLSLVAGKTTAYVCHDYECEKPINDKEQFANALYELNQVRNG
jgi:uncharacterized protein YyaL (SSP411 family)